MLKKTESESSITKMRIMKDYGFKNAWLSAFANGNGRWLTHDCCNENSGLDIVVNASYATAAPLAYALGLDQEKQRPEMPILLHS